MTSADIPELSWVYELKVTILKTAWVFFAILALGLWLAGCSPTPAPSQWEPFDVQRAEYSYHTNNDHYAYPPLGYGVTLKDVYFVAWPLRSWEW